MPRQIPEEEFDAIASLITGNPEGVRVRAIRDALEFDLPPRMLQRRLKHLIEAHRISCEGSGKGRRYFPVTVSPKDTRKAPSPVPAAGIMTLSGPAREVREAILAPISARTPVGYNSGFLAAYEPNRTAYLPQVVRNELDRIGQVGVSNLPAGTYIRKIMARLLIDLSWNSSRLEGNTYSLLETQRLFDLGESAEDKAAEETQMILNHKSAIEMLADQAEEIGFNRYTLCNLHALLSDNLLADPAACGRLRSVPVGIGGSVYHPLEIPQQIEQRFLELLQKAEAIKNPFEQAFFAMVHLPYLQPFEDVNKRVSRLAANIPLVRHNLCPLSFIDVPREDYANGLIGVYELNRVEYLQDVFLWAYKRSAARYSAVLQSLGDPDPFRLRYRAQIAEFVREIVKGGLDKHDATKWIANQAGSEIIEPDRAKFTEVVEIELGSLHEGNIARFRLRPREYDDWRKTWK